MKRNAIVLSVIALVLVLGTAIGTTWSFFTTYAETIGGLPIAFSDRTQIPPIIHEDFFNWTKRVTLESQEGAEPMYVRVKAFSGSQYELVYGSNDGRWTLGEDGFYYYNQVLNGGQTTSELLIRIENIPADAVDKDTFNVIVVYEYTPVLYRADGTPYADWNTRVNNGGNE